MTPLAPHLTAFIGERLPRERRASVHTCDAYAYAFRLLLSFASMRLGTRPSALMLEQLDVPLVLAFLEDLEKTRANSPRTRNARLAAIKSFARFVEYRVPSCLQQVHGLLAIPSKKTDEALVGFLTRDEMQAVLDSPDPKRRDGVRDRAMLHLAFAGGLRVSELVGLHVDELVLQPQAAVHVRGKGRRERVLPLWKTTVLPCGPGWHCVAPHHAPSCSSMAAAGPFPAMASSTFSRSTLRRPSRRCRLLRRSASRHTSSGTPAR